MMYPVTPIENKNDSIEIQKAEVPIPKAFLPKLGETITLENIFFATNKSELLPQSFSELDKLVQYLNETPNTSITISDHTDKTGNENQNKILSEARAKAVADYLILNGIDKTRISYIGFGSLKPIATNDTEEGKSKTGELNLL
jgi:OOP family OmpA-OmpF porin